MTSSNPRSVIYLDHAATTPCRPEVVEAMRRVLLDDFANPSSRHGAGLAAERHLTAARRQIAERVGVEPAQVTFTSGGTEANALALLSAARRGHVLISAVEHPSVLETARLLSEAGAEVERIPVSTAGRVDPANAEELVRSDTALVAVMHINNETGIVQPVAEISRAVKARAPRCRVLVDAVQSFTALPVDLVGLGADLISLSAHKIHGPKGVGCLISAPDLHIRHPWGGGDQEAGRRPGTENVPGIVGFGRALELCRADAAQGQRLRGYSDELVETVRRARSDAYAIGDADHRAPHIVAIAVPGVATEVLINLLEARGVCASSGSACHSRRSLRSHVTKAMKIPAGHGVLRFSLGTVTTDAEIARAVEELTAALGDL